MFSLLTFFCYLSFPELRSRGMNLFSPLRFRRSPDNGEWRGKKERKKLRLVFLRKYESTTRNSEKVGTYIHTYIHYIYSTRPNASGRKPPSLTTLLYFSPYIYRTCNIIGREKDSGNEIFRSKVTEKEKSSSGETRRRFVLLRKKPFEERERSPFSSPTKAL